MSLLYLASSLFIIACKKIGACATAIVLRLCFILRTSMSRLRHESVGALRINGREGASRWSKWKSWIDGTQLGTERCVSLIIIFAASVSRWVLISSYWSSFFTDDATFLRENVRNGAMCDVLVILLNQNAPRLD